MKHKFKLKAGDSLDLIFKWNYFNNLFDDYTKFKEDVEMIIEVKKPKKQVIR